METSGQPPYVDTAAEEVSDLEVSEQAGGTDGLDGRGKVVEEMSQIWLQISIVSGGWGWKHLIDAPQRRNSDESKEAFFRRQQEVNSDRLGTSAPGPVLMPRREAAGSEEIKGRGWILASYFLLVGGQTE